MKTVRSLIHRLRGLFRKEQLDRDMSDELAAHLEMHIADNVRAGMSPEEARRAALMQLGGMEQTKESMRERRSVPLLETVLHDVRFGLRMLRKSPGFTAVAVLTLALGIGANVAIFTLINGLILRPLPYPQPDRVVQVDRQMKEGPYYGMSLMEFRVYQRQNQTFECLAAYDMLGSGLSLHTGAEPKLIQSRRVSADFFRAIGIVPPMGRDFTAEDDRPGAAPVVILSYRIWKSLLNGNPAVIGQTVRMSGENYTVIGITSPNFAFAHEAEAWVPLRTAEDPGDHASAFHVIGRLRPGVGYQFASEDLGAVQQHIRRDYPGVIEPNQLGVLVTLYQDRVVGDVRPLLLLLAAAVSCVLLIACSNIANLQLARAVNRRKEIAIRTALGVTRTRLLRQLLTESTLLSLAGGACGLLLSHWCIRLFLALPSSGLPRVREIAIDVRVLLFTLAISVLTGLVFGAAPALQLGRLNPADVLRESGSASVSTRWLQGFLVSSEIFLATILLLGAGLLLSSFAKLLRVDPGFDASHVLTLKTSFVGPSFASEARVDAVVRKAVAHLQAVPGVQAVAAATMLPTEPSVQLPFELPWLPAAERPAPDSEVQWRAISPAYFEVMGIPVLQGRSFSEGDAAAGAPVVVVNQAFLRTYLSQESTIGQQVLIGRQEGPDFADKSREIVGVVADTREIGLNEPASPTAFIPLAQVPDRLVVLLNRLMPMSWLIRVSGEPLAFRHEVHEEFLAADRDLVTSNPRPLAEVLSTSLAQQRMQTGLLGLFSAAALLLGAIGLYGVLAYSVEERKREIGIRMALGAKRGQILGLVIAHGLKLTLTGLVLGTLCGLALARFMRNLLFGTSATDPLTLAIVSGVLMLVAVAACWIPARRATRVDPMIALRYE
ncbi:MAG: ABC transporter permease [Candidatus Acidiferrum sp.]